MGYKLPEMKYADGIRQHVSMTFGGINHNLYARDGELYDGENLTTDLYPLMGSRPKRKHITLWDGATGMCRFEDSIVRSTEENLITGEHENYILATLPERSTPRKLIPFGHYIIIMPDKLVYDGSIPATLTPQTPEPMDSTATVTATFEDGTIYGESAAGNTIHADDVDWSDYFRVGDAVQIESTSNSLSAIIREIDGEDLRFYENSFTVTGTAESVTVKRESPQLDVFPIMFEHKNRLWAAYKNTIYASKLGDPFNWNFFDGTAEDSWSVEVMTGDGMIRGGVSYAYPTFFKENRIFRIYGDKPSQFQMTETVAPGGDSGSCVVINNVLYYRSKKGVMAYTGSTPQIISHALGSVPITGNAGTDGIKYYLSGADAYNRFVPKLFVYDTRFGTWQIEDDAEFGTKEFAQSQSGMVMLRHNEPGAPDYDSEIWCVVNKWDEYDLQEEEAEDTVQSFAEFGDFIEADPNSKTTGKLLLRAQLGANAVLQVKISIDDGEWEDYGTLTNPIPEGQPETKIKRSKYLAIVPRRCDHYRIKLIGTGEWVLYSMTRETASGSQLKTV